MQINYKIGLNIGINFVGWSVINIDNNKVEKLGVRCFDVAEQLNSGESLFLNRSVARNRRRTIRRKKFRLERIKKLFLKEKWIRKDDISKYFGEFSGLTSKDKSPWQLRAEALEKKLTYLELSRILYHIAKKRGFLLNENREGHGEIGKLLKGVIYTHSLIEKKAYKTIAQMVMSDSEFSEKIRNKSDSYIHTFSRMDIKNEIDLIFKSQEKFGLFISEEFKENYIKLFNLQRTFDEGPSSPSPYYYEKGQIDKMRGKCCFEKDENRASIGCFSAEKFIALSKLTKINFIKDGFSNNFNKEQIEIILNNLKDKNELSLKDIKEILGLEEVIINISGNQCINENEKLIKLRNYHKIRECFFIYNKNYRDKISEEDIDFIANTIHFFKDKKEKINELSKLGIPEEIIRRLIELSFSKTIHLSLKALKKINTKLEEGLSYFEACKELNYIHNISEKKMFLPIFAKEEVKNPVVLRAFSQARKIINEIIRIYGSPINISFKLDNKLDKSFKNRKELELKEIQYKHKTNKLITGFKEIFSREPNKIELFKYKLYLEQNKKCLLTSKEFNLKKLISEKNYAYIDYIVPYNVSYNTSENNRVLIFSEDKVNKYNKTPYEYFEKDFDMWAVFKNNLINTQLSSKKIKNLLTINTTEYFIRNQKRKYLEDSSYFGKYFEEYIIKNLIFKEHDFLEKVVRKVSNNLVAYIRDEFSILDKLYEYEDLYYSIDALIIPFITDSFINKIENYESQKINLLYSILDKDSSLLKTFFIEESKVINKDTIEALLDKIIVTRTSRRKGKGLAHDYTIRSKKLINKGINYTYVRKSISSITELDIITTKETPLYLSDKKSYDFLLSNLLENKKINIFFKPSKNGKGQKVEKMKIASKEGISGIYVNKGIAANGNIVRIDLFKKNSKYYFIPIYTHHLIKHYLPNAVVSEKDEKLWINLDESFIFCYSIYPNDYIKIIKKNTEIEGYFLKANRRTNSISIYNHKNKKNITTSIGIRNILSIIKYDVSLLGDKHEIKYMIKRLI